MECNKCIKNSSELSILLSDKTVGILCLPVEVSMIKLRFFATALQKRLCCDKS